ncbi:uncharacterized protein LOC131242157 [Magnolia sinica]|uniref:uncharacterized protein LOC131242157 n=1 Tax=Magnolia sinica TaxID=86752 RepID=UPI0026590AB5|nr:uncharacterized protein LOC131242157 [Magnolia sinica]
METMNKFRSLGKILLLSVFIFSTLILSTVGKGGSNDEKLEKHEPNPAERAIGTVPPANPWMKISSWMQTSWMNFRSPNTEVDKGDPARAGGVMEDAVTKSFETCKETVENAAEFAARATGEAVHKTAEKVKSTLSTSKDEEPDTEF